MATSRSANAANDAAVASANGLGTQPLNDSLMLPAGHSETVDSGNSTPRRQLAPPSAPASATVDTNPSQVGRRLPLHFGLPSNAAYSVASALAIVVGLFLLFVWLLRRGSKITAKKLPAEVVSVLGRVPIAPKQHADLLRVGNKLVLVAQTTSGPTPLTEVTDSLEVERLIGLCQQADPHSTTKAFEQVFRQLAREPAPAGFLGQDAALASRPSIESLRQFRNEAARA